jgi:hypothetical protein
MNYQRHYSALIERAKARATIDGYSERHHIIPRCMDGGDEPENLVRLTAEEHFVAHQLLAKIHPDNEKLLYGALLMVTAAHTGRSENKLYGWLKKRLAIAQSAKFKGRAWSEEQNAARAARVKAQWADPEFRAKMEAAIAKGRVNRKPVAEGKLASLREFRREQTKKRWQDPEYRAAQTEKNRARKMTDEQKAAVAAWMRGRVVSEATREKLRAATLAYFEKLRAEGA